MRRLVRFLACLACLVTACSKQPPRIPETEARTARAFLSYSRQGPLALHAFLAQFPKGADLHVHLSGAVYAETFIRDAAEDGVCVDPVNLSFVKPPCRGNLIPASNLSGNIDRQTQLLYDKLTDALSVRSFVPSAAGASTTSSLKYLTVPAGSKITPGSGSTR